MEQAKNGIIKSTLLSQFPELAHGSATKLLGNMSLDWDKDNRAEKTTDDFLELLKISGLKTSLGILKLNSGANVALVQKHFSKRRNLIDVNAIQATQINSWEKSDEGIDAAVSKSERQILGIFHADCAPVLFYAPTQKVFAIAHSGLPGTTLNISRRTLDSMKEWFKIEPQEVFAYVGPCICSNCYNPRKSQWWQKLNLKDEFGDDFDLREIIHQQLIIAGVPDSQIEISEYCTSCNSSLFYSHHHGGEGRTLTVIGLR